MKTTTRQMIKSSWTHILSLIGIISFLLFFLNLLFILSYNAQVFNENVKEKLGIYLYLDDADEAADLVYSEAIDMKSKLETAGMRVQFYSKEDAFQILEARLPNVIENFEKYGIDNPLPPTMYVQFNNEEDYSLMKQVVLQHEDVIMNLDDLESDGFAFTEQERRSANVINLTNFITNFGYFLIVVILAIIIAFLLFGLKLTFYRFREQIEVEKLLWADYLRIKKPFLIIAVVVLVSAFALMLVYFWWFLWVIDEYFRSVFQISAWEYLLPSISRVWEFLAEEAVILIVLSLLFTMWFMSGLIRRV